MATAERMELQNSLLLERETKLNNLAEEKHTIETQMKELDAVNSENIEEEYQLKEKHQALFSERTELEDEMIEM